MAAVSIIEFLVYAFITYSSLLMLIISSIRETPDTRSQSLMRSVYLIPGMVCAVLLAGAGLDIEFETPGTTIINETTYNATGYLTFTVITNSTSVEPDVVTLQNPVWVLIHFMIFAILLVYVITQLLALMTKL